MLDPEGNLVYPLNFLKKKKNDPESGGIMILLKTDPDSAVHDPGSEIIILLKTDPDKILYGDSSETGIAIKIGKLIL